MNSKHFSLNLACAWDRENIVPFIAKKSQKVAAVYYRIFKIRKHLPWLNYL